MKTDIENEVCRKAIRTPDKHVDFQVSLANDAIEATTSGITNTGQVTDCLERILYVITLN
jgi:hypothetical protein